MHEHDDAVPMSYAAPRGRSTSRRTNSSGVCDGLAALIDAAPEGLSARMLHELWSRPDLGEPPMDHQRPTFGAGREPSTKARSRGIAPHLRRLVRERRAVPVGGTRRTPERYASPAVAARLQAADDRKAAA